MKARALAAIVMIACTACGILVGPDSATTPLEQFDRVWRDLDLHYSFFVVKKINWDSLDAVYRPAAAAARDELAGAAAISQLLESLHDRHVTLSICGNPCTSIPLAQRNALDPGTRRVTDVQNVGGFASGVSYDFATPTVGYIQIQTFEGSGWSADLDTALAGLGAVHAIIIDVRENGGGALENATEVAGRFTQHTTTFANVRYRNGPAHTDFTAPIAQRVGRVGQQNFSGPLFVLTNRGTFSAAELFVLALRANGRTTVVGDTTGGQAGTPIVRELQNGWTYQFPESVEFTLDGRVFEGTGLPPDDPIQISKRDNIDGVDSQLERAIALAMGNP